MGLRNIAINYSYETGHDDPINDFYVPLLAEAISYDRIAGFFSSSSLAVAARGIAGLIKNGGRMRIIACPRLDRKDAAVIANLYTNPEEYLSVYLLEDLEQIEDEFQRDHVRALGWMLSNDYLEMKIALVKKTDDLIDPDSLFHQKIGIMTDSAGNQISFSGSINETASGWLKNIEEFKVFKSWEPGQDSYLLADANRFEEFWSNSRQNCLVTSLPTAVTNKLIQIAAEFSKERFIASNYVRTRKQKDIEECLNLFPYQEEAFATWKKNDYRLLFEMATGTGKTRTAIACMNFFLKSVMPGLIIVSCPQSTLSLQWKCEVESIGLKFDNIIIADGSNESWRSHLKQELKMLSIGFHKHAIIYTTHTTASNVDFIDIMQTSSSKVKMCFVGDEAHGLGAYRSKNALLDIYTYRIGLSATPSRWFDDYGTSILIAFFGNKSYKFSIAQALTTLNPLTNKPFLVEYEYHPVFVSLSDDEIEQFKKLSNRIRKMTAFSNFGDEYQKKLERLLFARASIEKNAESKYNILIDILKSIPISNTLIFTSDMQISEVMKILQRMGIIAHRFTQEQGTKQEQQFNGLSERQYLIKKFKDGTYQALVAIKCLDEGIDIPIADTAIIMASSTNPREYIQRVGRVIRQAMGKKRAYIYDFVIEPEPKRLEDPDLIEFERQIFMKEMLRVKDMSTNSINNAQVLIDINTRLRRVTHGA